MTAVLQSIPANNIIYQHKSSALYIYIYLCLWCVSVVFERRPTKSEQCSCSGCSDERRAGHPHDADSIFFASFLIRQCTFLTRCWLDSLAFIRKQNIFLTKWKQSRTHAPSIYTLFSILIDPYVNWISDWQILVNSSSKTTSSTATSSQPPAWGRAPSCDCNCSPDRQLSSRGLPRKREKASKRERKKTLASVVGVRVGRALFIFIVLLQTGGELAMTLVVKNVWLPLMGSSSATTLKLLLMLVVSTTITPASAQDSSRLLAGKSSKLELDRPFCLILFFFVKCQDEWWRRETRENINLIAQLDGKSMWI